MHEIFGWIKAVSRKHVQAEEIKVKTVTAITIVISRRLVL